MTTPTEAPSHALTWRDARRWIAILFGVLFGLPLAVHLVQNACVHRDIARIGAAGGVVVATTDRSSSALEEWLEQRPPWFQQWYVVRPRYEVYFGQVPAGGYESLGDSATIAGVDPRTMMGRAGDPGDAGLETVRGLGRVSGLWLSETSVSDEGLLHLRDLGALQELRLDGTRVTGPGLAYLRGLRLRVLSLEDTPIDDRALVHVVALTGLRELGLGLTRVTGAGLAVLARLPELAWLDLHQTNLGDADLVHLSQLPVTRLDLSDTDVTEAGLEALRGLPSLAHLTLCGVSVTREGLDRLRAGGRLTVTHSPVECGPFTAPQAIRRKRRPPR